MRIITHFKNKKLSNYVDVWSRDGAIYLRVTNSTIKLSVEEALLLMLTLRKFIEKVYKVG